MRTVAFPHIPIDDDLRERNDLPREPVSHSEPLPSGIRGNDNVEVKPSVPSLMECSHKTQPPCRRSGMRCFLSRQSRRQPLLSSGVCGAEPRRKSTSLRFALACTMEKLHSAGNNSTALAVNVAARVAAQAAGGQVLGTESVAEAARGAGLAARSLGAISLKNLREPIHLFDIGLGG